MWELPDPSSVILSHQKNSSNSNTEQVVILTLCGKDMSQGLSLVHRVLTEKPEGFKLFGLKWLPELTQLQAQELSPYGVGGAALSSQPGQSDVLPCPSVCSQTGGCFCFTEEAPTAPLISGNLSVLMSLTPEVASRQAAIFVFKHEMISDHSVHPVEKFPSQNCSTKGSHQKAIEDIKRLFPDGLCCNETSTMRQEQIINMHSDPRASVERQQNCTLAPVAQESLSPSVVSGQNGGIHSSLWQTTCLLIPLNAPPLSQVPSQLDMLEQLLRSGCHLVAGRMSMLGNEQRKNMAAILNVSPGDERMTHLFTAPCLIIALQGEETVACFDLILKSIYKERPDLEKVGKMIIYPESQNEANQLICYLFDALSPGSQQAIVP